MESDVLLVISTVPDATVAERIARVVVEAGLAACVNISPAVKSVYRWKGAIEEAGEVLLFIKTTTARYPELEEAIRMHHPYEVPEIIAIPICRGLPAYLRWIQDATRPEGAYHA